MRKPVTWADLLKVIGVLTPFVVWFMTSINGTLREVPKQGQKIQNIETTMYNNQLSTDKKLDRIEIKIDRIVTKPEFK